MPQAPFSTSHSMYAMILAGGSGERFWPLSRNCRPKQLLKLFSEKTLLEDTLARLKGLIPPDQILIVTNRNHEAEIRSLLPDFPEENIISEPAKRDTAPAIALGVGLIARRDPFASIVVLPADHLIQNVKAFQQDIRTAVAAAQDSGTLVTIGIKPTWACPGYGYIEMGDTARIKADTPVEVHTALRFREKPNPELAERFLRAGNFRWNAGMFVWTVPSICSEFRRHAVELAEFISILHTSPDVKKTIEQRFPKLPKNSIDYAILEKAARVLVVEAGFDWDDVGSWTALASYLPKDEAGNTTNQPITICESSNNIVFSDSPTHVALVGVRDLIVVRTGDSILVANRHEVEKVKQIVANLPANLK